jgi:probable HAF family extracellular repeat protein
MSDLGTLGGGFSNAVGINDPGSVVGTANNTEPDLIFGGQRNLAFLWQKGVMSDLGTLGGPDSVSNSVNDRTQVVGYAYNTTPDPSAPFSAPQFHPFLWQNGVMQDLRPFGSDPDAVAAGINNQGQIVGGSGNFFQPFQAVLWHNGTVTDLNTLIPATSGWQLLAANAINTQGQIVGYGINPAGHFRGFLLTPTTSGGPPGAGVAVSPSHSAARIASFPVRIQALVHWGKPNLGGQVAP